MTKSFRNRIMHWPLLAAVPAFLLAAGAHADAATYQIRVAPQSFAQALRSFADQTQLQVVYPAELGAGLTSPGAQGTLTAEQALQSLLNGTGLSYQFINDRTIAIGAPKPGRGADAGAPSLRLASGEASTQVAQAAAPAAAPQAAQGQRGLEEIVVTARKREENLIDIPIAVTAFSSAKIEAVGVKDLQELSKFTPGLSVANQGTGFGGRLFSGIRFRGMNQSVLTPTNQVGALFVDGIYFLGGAQSVGFDDVERVEVIRGPQAAYFGRSTFGGAINYITKDPGNVLSGQANAEYSPNFDSFALSGAVEGPILGDKVTARLSAGIRRKGAQYTATDGGKLGREESRNVNGTVLFRPTDALKVKLRATYAEDDDGSPAFTTLSYTRYGNRCGGQPITYTQANGQTRSAPITIPYHCGALPFSGVPISMNTVFPSALFPPATVAGFPGTSTLNVRDVLANNSFNSRLLARAPDLDEFGIKRELQRYSGAFDFALTDSLTLSGNAAYNKQATNQIRDGDNSDNVSVFIASPNIFRDYSMEARLSYDGGGRLRGLFGANYYNQKTELAFANAVEATYGFSLPPTFALSRPHPLTNPVNNDKVKTTGVFGSIEFDIFEQLTATFEGRYQQDKFIRFSGSELAGIVQEPAITSKKFLPRAILSWRPMDEMTIYAQFAQGTLPGDNTNIATFRTLTAGQREEVTQLLGDVAQAIPAEELDSYEIGIKQALFDGALRYALTGYYMEWRNQKAATSLFLTRDLGRTVGFRVPGNSEVKGVEFEADWAATDNLQLSGTLNYTNAKYTSFPRSDYATLFTGGTALIGYDAKGNTQPRFPIWSGTLSATWSDTLIADWDYYVRGDAIYTGKQYIDELNLAWIKSYTTFNARVGFVRDQALTIELFATNLFNKKGWATGSGHSVDLTLAQAVTLPLQRGAAVTPIDKRQFGIRASYKF
jgi:iron complex outermembrane receptor protein